MKKFQNIATGLLIAVATISCTNGASKNKTANQDASDTSGVIVSAGGDDETITENSKLAKAAKINHSAFDKLLKANVSNSGSVDYKAFVKNKSNLQGYLALMARADVSKMNKNEQTAYWINVYNAATVDQIVRAYPTSSITKIAGGKVWDQALPYNFNGKKLTLNDIEKKILLGRDLFDARVHFSVNCAAVSCPILSNKAFTGENVQEMLTKNTKAALADPKFNKISSNSAAVSKLFDWYKADFVKAEGSVVKFINKYSDTKIDGNTKITYMDYNWSLNGK